MKIKLKVIKSIPRKKLVLKEEFLTSIIGLKRLIVMIESLKCFFFDETCITQILFFLIIRLI